VKAIWLRQDKLPGAPLKINLAATPRTALSTANTADRPTALAARREMQSWMQLQLEPSKLRSSDRFSNEEDKQRLTSDGAHLPATLLRLNACDQVAMMVSKLLPDIRGLRIDVNKESRLQTLYMQQIDGTEHAARALSDGTLRFLALSTLACDDMSTGVICMEEPENGIHPARIPAILDLLREMAVDTDEAVGADNPLRQVIINTHSPSVIKALNPNELVVASSVRWNNQNVTCFGFIQGNENGDARVMWRSDVIAKGIPAPSVTVGKLIAYLGNIKIAHAVPVQPKSARDIENWAQGKLQLDGLIE
jgi:predicted ATPase